ncbi:MAG: AAA family ATPase, partial [Verrucomicrobiae bacterium]|nr:AAA family ATPase [Verrucomicrobiae bacterium]
MPAPRWSDSIRTHYLSGAANQFVLHGNVNDRLLLPADAESGKPAQAGNLPDYLIQHQLRKFDLVLSYELGAGLRVEAGAELFRKLRPADDLPKDPPSAIGYLDHLLRFLVNLRQLKPGETPPKDTSTGPVSPSAEPLAGRNFHVSFMLKGADLVFPRNSNSLNYQLSAMASVVRSWSKETHFLDQNLAVFLIAENLNDLHPLLASNPRSAVVDIDMPDASELVEAFGFFAQRFPKALSNFANSPALPAERLAGATLGSIEGLLKTREYESRPLVESDLSELKKDLVEKDSQGLIEFLEPTRTLEDVYGSESVKAWMRQDIALWQQNDLEAMPMGYLLCGPVGTGKTYLVECLAGEAGVPVVKMKNFREKWVGSTEGNLEKILDLVDALGYVLLIIDEADRSLSGGDNDGGTSSRVIARLKEFMSETSHRGKVVILMMTNR